VRWDSIKVDLDGSHPIHQSMRYPFSCNQALKYAYHNVKLEDALGIQPLP
jgi:hypothetical protein